MSIMPQKGPNNSGAQEKKNYLINWKQALKKEIKYKEPQTEWIYLHDKSRKAKLIKVID